jgi:hypothetical protein
MASADREAVMEAVLEAMCRGETVDSAAKAQGVASGTVRQWFARDEAWRGRYREARLIQGQAMAEEAVRIAREATNYSTSVDKLLIETLKWAAAKANPAEYGEKQTVEHQGSQQLQVKIVEEEGVPRQVRGLESAVEHALLTGERVIHTLGSGKGAAKDYS